MTIKRPLNDSLRCCDEAAPSVATGFLLRVTFGFERRREYGEESDGSGMDWSGSGARWADQSALGSLRGPSHRRAPPHRPFPLTICLCPVPFFSFSPFHLVLPLIVDSSSQALSLVRSLLVLSGHSSCFLSFRATPPRITVVLLLAMDGGH